MLINICGFFLLFSYLFLSFHDRCLALDIGNNNSVTTVSQPVSFPSGAGNSIVGFTVLENGFNLQDSTATCTLAILFPITGEVCLNGGRIYLLDDLDFAKNGALVNGGSIYANQRSVNFNANDFSYPKSGVYVLTEDATYDGGTEIVSIDWSFDNAFIVLGSPGALMGLLGNNFSVLEYSPGALTVRASANFGSAVNSVRWHPLQHDLAVAGMTNMLSNELEIWRFNAETYSFSMLSGINWGISGFALSVAWRPQGDYIAAGRNTTTAELSVYPYNKTTGALGSAISADISPNAVTSQGSIDWDPSGTYLVAGVTSTSGTELKMYYFTGSSLTSTLSVEIGATVDAVSWASTGSYIIAGMTSGTERFKIFQHDVQNGTLTEVAGNDSATTVLSGQWSADGRRIIVGTPAGSIPELQVFAFDGDSKSLRNCTAIGVGADVNDARWSPNTQYIAACDSSGFAHVYTFTELTDAVSNTLLFHDATLFFVSDIELSAPLKFSGACKIDANSNWLSFAQDGAIIVDADSSLLCNNMTMTNISADRIHMLDASSSLSLCDLTLLLEDDFTFTQGNLSIWGEVAIVGPGNVTYASPQRLTINDDSVLKLQELTFTYNPSAADKTLLYMQTASAKLALHDVALHVTTTGMQLTKGILQIQGLNTITSDGTIESEAIQLGDGLDPINNICLQLLVSSGLTIDSGYVVYNNIS